MHHSLKRWIILFFQFFLVFDENTKITLSQLAGPYALPIKVSIPLNLMNWERKRFSMKNKCKCYSFLTLKDKEIRTCSQEPQIESGRALLFTQLALLERKFFNFSQKKLNLYVFTSFRHYVFPSLSLSLREFKKSLPNTFIYESILIKIYANVNIMKSQNVTFMFILTLTYVLMDIFYPCFFQRFNDIKNL